MLFRAKKGSLGGSHHLDSSPYLMEQHLHGPFEDLQAFTSSPPSLAPSGSHSSNQTHCRRQIRMWDLKYLVFAFRSAGSATYKYNVYSFLQSCQHNFLVSPHAHTVANYKTCPTRQSVINTCAFNHLRVAMPFLKCLVGGRRKDQPGSLGTEE